MIVTEVYELRDIVKKNIKKERVHHVFRINSKGRTLFIVSIIKASDSECLFYPRYVVKELWQDFLKRQRLTKLYKHIVSIFENAQTFSEGLEALKATQGLIIESLYDPQSVVIALDFRDTEAFNYEKTIPKKVIDQTLKLLMQKMNEEDIKSS